MSLALEVVSGAAIKNILVATDFSPCADSAMPAAGAVARRFHSRIHFLHVIGRESATLTGKPGASPLQECEQALKRLRVISSSEPFNDSVCHLIAQPGAVANIAIESAKQFDIDLIILGTHGRSGLKRILLGSVAEEIVQHATCAVMTVGPNIRAQAFENGDVGTILFATRFLAGSLHALDYAVSFARKFNSRLVAVHVVGNGVIGTFDELMQRAREHLEKLLPDDIPHEVVVRHGPVAETILRIAAERNASLIAMGARSGIAEEAPWATTHRIIAEARSPVLTTTFDLH